MDREMPPQSSSLRVGQVAATLCLTSSPTTPPPPRLTSPRPWKSSPAQTVAVKAAPLAGARRAAAAVAPALAKPSPRAHNGPPPPPPLDLQRDLHHLVLLL